MGNRTHRFQWTKQVASHLGGTRDPLIVSWPGHIKDAGGLRTQFHHVTDIAPDSMHELVSVQFPDMVNGVKQLPLEGVSMVYSFLTIPNRQARITCNISKWSEIAAFTKTAGGPDRVTCCRGRVPNRRTGEIARSGKESLGALQPERRFQPWAHDLSARYPEKLERACSSSSIAKRAATMSTSLAPHRAPLLCPRRSAVHIRLPRRNGADSQ